MQHCRITCWAVLNIPGPHTVTLTDCIPAEDFWGEAVYTHVIIEFVTSLTTNITNKVKI